MLLLGFISLPFRMLQTMAWEMFSKLEYPAFCSRAGCIVGAYGMFVDIIIMADI